MGTRVRGLQLPLVPLAPAAMASCSRRPSQRSSAQQRQHMQGAVPAFAAAAAGIVTLPAAAAAASAVGGACEAAAAPLVLHWRRLLVPAAVARVAAGKPSPGTTVARCCPGRKQLRVAGHKVLLEPLLYVAADAGLLAAAAAASAPSQRP